MTTHEIHGDVKYTSLSHNPKNFSNSTIKLQTPISLKLCKIANINCRFLISTFEFFIINIKMGLEIFAGEALGKILRKLKLEGNDGFLI